MSDDFVLVLDQGAIDRLLNDPVGVVANALKRVAVQIESVAKRMCPVDFGRLRASITHFVRLTAEGLVAYIGSNVHYTQAVEFGTGLWSEKPGSARKKITPKRAKALRWTTKTGEVVFARSTKGQMAQAFLRPAMHQVALRNAA